MMAFNTLLRHVVLSVLIACAALAPGHEAAAREAVLRPWPTQTPTPDLRLVDLEGRQWSREALRGKVVVLNFWASWCGPCVEELPILNELAQGNGSGDKPVVLGVNFKESAAVIERFMQAHPFQYPVVQDKTGEVFKQWGTGGVMPATILIDRQGRARWRVVGALERGDAAFGRALETLLEEPGAAKATRTSFMNPNRENQQ